MIFDTPVIVRVWRDGERIFEQIAYSVDTNGERIRIHTTDGLKVYRDSDSWDELTVDYNPT